MSYWKRNIVVLCCAQLLTLIGFSAYLPLIPYYIQELGVQGYQEATSWFAAFNTAGAVSMMIAAPIWGGLSDRHGRKVMLVRATLAGSILAFALSLVQTPLQLVALRVLQGMLCGTVGAANTLVATETPEESLGQGLGAIQTAQFVGQALGPLVGGFVADWLGYRAVFPVSAALMAISFIAVTSLVREKARITKPRRTRGRAPLNRRALAGAVTRNSLMLLIALASTSFAFAVVSPVLSLYIQVLDPANPRIATLAGAVVSASALTSSLSALAMGRLGDRVGQKIVLVGCMIGIGCIYVPQGLVGRPMHLLWLRAIQGVFMGGIMPTANALLAQSTPSARRGTIFGLAASFQAGGRAVGPMVGAATANTLGMASVFFVTAGVFALISILVGGLVPARPALAEESIEALRQTERGHVRASTPS